MTPLAWVGGKLRILDQTRLPGEVRYLELAQPGEVVQAIREMRVRGAPAIGLAGAYAMALAAQSAREADLPAFLKHLRREAEVVAAARPTAVNLAWAVQRVWRAVEAAQSAEAARASALAEAQRLHCQGMEAERRLADYGAGLVPPGATVLTHCNTGALATGCYGTALGVLRRAWVLGRLRRVVATETRPLLQGARLTMWELAQYRIPATLVVDAAAGVWFQRGELACVVVGADRIAANGDVANKVGTYTLAVLAHVHGVPFYVAAPISTIDLHTPSGRDTMIERRRPEEVSHLGWGWGPDSQGLPAAPEGVEVDNPAFDITPADYVTAVITEAGVLRPPYQDSLQQVKHE
ncbi:MAG: S-methyl-5-thioribose-1-phosphate isomerase [Chloroflexi bacterium]|nr:S-methyl-5-thioribose-1-phosphate isomerase [Chloroflexota bacterium]